MTKTLMQRNMESLTVSCRLAVESYRHFPKATCVFSVVPGLVSRAVGVQSCRGDNGCSFGGRMEVAH